MTRWLTRAGGHAQALHERFFCHLWLPHLQVDELRTRLRSQSQVQWLWVAIDPQTKILPVLELGPRTQPMAHRLIHSLRQKLAPGCLPLFTSDGLNLYVYAITAHFGQWLTLAGRGRHVRRWQVAPRLIYGQVNKCYRRRKLVRVWHGLASRDRGGSQGCLAGGRLLWPAEHGLYRAGRSSGPTCRGSPRETHLGHGAALP